MTFKEGEIMTADFGENDVKLLFKNLDSTVLLLIAGDTNNGDTAVMQSPPNMPDDMFDALVVSAIRTRAASNKTTSADVIMDRISMKVNTNKFKYRGKQE